ncbi:MAG: hypothetical protein J6H18_00270, partial [Lachnospiraceae bacterium]|nr:hypothetical protein [Lachnospiraceae bacterium]
EETGGFDFSEFLQDQSAALFSTAAAAAPVSDTHELPAIRISEAEKTEEELPADPGKTTVLTQLPEKEEKAHADLSGPTKKVNKVGTSTGSIGAIGMSEEGFVTYAKNYLASIDCVLDDAGEMALQNAAEARKEAGILLTKEEAENMIEEAADMSERKGGLFSKRYNKEGFLILKGKFIK